MAVKKQASRSRHTIVVPTDFSARSTHAMRLALDLAGQGSKVIAVHALDPFPYQFGPEESSNLKRKETWTKAQQSMADWLQHGRFSNCDAIIVEGEAAPAIIRFTAAQGADFVVLATSARRHVPRLLLGSVAEEIFREIKSPVFVLGPKSHPPRNQKLLRIVFATDLEPHSLAALSPLSRIGNMFDSEVSVFRAVPAGDSRKERSRIEMETRERFEAAADRALRQRIRKIHIEFAQPAKAITSFANSQKADAIAMGIRSGGEVSRAVTHIPWTLAHRVIAEAKCPVLVIRG